MTDQNYKRRNDVDAPESRQAYPARRSSSCLHSAASEVEPSTVRQVHVYSVC